MPVCEICGEVFNVEEAWMHASENDDLCLGQRPFHNAKNQDGFKTLKDAARSTSRKKPLSRAQRIAARRRFVTDD